MKETTPQTIHLKDYTPPHFSVDTLDLRFDLFDDHCLVKNKMTLTRRTPGEPLVLDGAHLELLSVKVDGQTLDDHQFSLTETDLTLFDLSDQCTLEIDTKIEPHKNLSYEGLYKSGSIFLTQCEAQGFRTMTYFLDRPDVMTTYTTTITADKTKYPVLLSNGNRTGKTDLPNNRHMARWHDPHKKPSYLFALVAGDLGVLEDQFTTRSGRKVKLQIFASHDKVERCHHAMSSLKKAMKWDETTYGLEYDLDIFMVVAADDFNAGAMENKGLNIFNSAYILADPQTATDKDYDHILGVVGHEYFHNWTGNRVTCRDWFQLSLKEGLTVYRDQEFSADMTSRGVKRIEDVKQLRATQFPEDSSPMSHPVRPQSYIQINNFYTSTVYNKGAEVIRMIEEIVGPEGFKKGLKKYFELYDGMAVTTEDFVHAHELANNLKLTQFKLWYDLAGTPRLKVKSKFRRNEKVMEVEVQQDFQKAMHIPLRVGLLDPKTGTELKSQTLEIKKSKQVFKIRGIKQKPILSVLRGFSAPVRLDYPYTDEEILFLVSHDTDSFARWEAAQTLYRQNILALAKKAARANSKLALPKPLAQAYKALLSSSDLDPAFWAHILTLPPEPDLGMEMDVVNVEGIHRAREFIIQAAANKFREQWLEIYEKFSVKGAYTYDALAVGKRSMRNIALRYLTSINDTKLNKLALKQFQKANNMTDRLGALACLNNVDCEERTAALEEFKEMFKDDALTMNKWFAIQALSKLPDTPEKVESLAQHPLFDIHNPNKVYSLFREFGRSNPMAFHRADGYGYRLLADKVLEIDSSNPQVAARVVSVFNNWKKYDKSRQALQKAELEKIVKHRGLSSNVYEIVTRNLG